MNLHCDFVNVEENGLARQASVRNILFGLDARRFRKEQRLLSSRRLCIAAFAIACPPDGLGGIVPSGAISCSDVAGLDLAATGDAIRRSPVVRGVRINAAKPVLVGRPVNLRQ
jgi:hypothetical protein